jgi:hypothetical protein
MRWSFCLLKSIENEGLWHFQLWVPYVNNQICKYLAKAEIAVTTNADSGTERAISNGFSSQKIMPG